MCDTYYVTLSIRIRFALTAIPEISLGGWLTLLACRRPRSPICWESAAERSSAGCPERPLPLPHSSDPPTGTPPGGDEHMAAAADSTALVVPQPSTSAFIHSRFSPN